MRISHLSISGGAIVESDRFTDDRGWFYRAFCQKQLASVLRHAAPTQINLSHTTHAGTVRGLHFQKSPGSEIKCVRCIRGAAWDVMVDLRRNSPTFLQWQAVELRPGPPTMVVIPAGCAHGFQALQDDTELLYLHTAAYQPDLEDGVHYADPRLNIAWPIPITMISLRDQSLSKLPTDYTGINT